MAENTNYRVNIKSFPDYKHLLQENYVEYIFFLKMSLNSRSFFLETNLTH